MAQSGWYAIFEMKLQSELTTSGNKTGMQYANLLSHFLIFVFVIYQKKQNVKGRSWDLRNDCDFPDSSWLTGGLSAHAYPAGFWLALIYLASPLLLFLTDLSSSPSLTGFLWMVASPSLLSHKSQIKGTKWVSSILATVVLDCHSSKELQKDMAREPLPLLTVMILTSQTEADTPFKQPKTSSLQI